MRAYRKREWSSLVINMTPLIDVVFLIIIFFIMMMTFSDVLNRKVTLPKADKSTELRQNIIKRVSITVKSDKMIFVDRKKVDLYELEEHLKIKLPNPSKSTVQLRGEENLPYDIIQKVMEKIALAGITLIEFSTKKDESTPLKSGKPDETAY
jgi:biopolymer transport protein ExbD